MVLHLFLHPVMKFYETIHNAPWSPEVKQLIVPAALHVPCAMDLLVVFKSLFAENEIEDLQFNCN